MWVIVRPLYIPQKTFGDQASRNNGRCADDFFNPGAAEIKRICIHVDLDTVNIYLLTDIAGNEIDVIATLFEIIILLFCRAIGEVKRSCDIRSNYFLIWVQREEKLVEHPNMVACLHRDIVFPVDRKSTR